MSGNEQSVMKLANCSVLDRSCERWNNNMSIIIENGIITKVGRENEMGMDVPHETVFDIRNKYVIPGLVDLHTHISFDGSPNSWSLNALLKDKPGYRSIKSALEAKKHLMSGFTTIRDLGSLDYDDLVVKRAINEGIIDGPDILASGKALSMTGGHGDLWVRGDVSPVSFGRIVNGVDQMRLATRETIKAGADWIKILGTGGVASEGDLPNSSQFDIDELRVSTYEAHAANRKVAIHAHGAKGIRLAIDAKADSVEHGSLLVEEPDLADQLADKKIGFVPTLSVTDRVVTRGPEQGLPSWAIEKAEQNIQMHKESVKLASRKGVMIGLGTDSGYMVRHGESAYELKLLKEVGLSDVECIKAGTINAAIILGKEKFLGTIEAGKRADMVITSKDPLDGIESLVDQENILSVFSKGLIKKGRSLLSEGEK